MKTKNVKSEQGLITVEAVLSLVPFMMIILGIISFTNLFAVHNKIQYALFQAGNEISGYTYLYQASGLRNADKELGKDIDNETKPIDDTVVDFNKFTDALSDMQNINLNNADKVINETVSTGNKLYTDVSNLLSDPQGMLSGAVYLLIEAGEDRLKSGIGELLSQGLVEMYLDSSFSDGRTADEYLKTMGVKNGVSGLDFSGSSIFRDDDYSMIELVVQYDVEIHFFKLFMKDPTVSIVQYCTVPAWLDGDGSTIKGVKK